MKTVIFVCHGNICRSVAAEYIMKQLLKDYGLDDRFIVYSRATSLEEIGNDIYPPMKRALSNHDIEYGYHQACQISKEDYENADYIFYMDSYNKRNLLFRFNDYKNIILPVTKYNPEYGCIDDPWYSGQFDKVVEQLIECIKNIIQNIK